MKTFEQCFNKNLADYSDQIVESGCISGIIPNITLTQDCVNLFNQYDNEIWNILVEKSAGEGYRNVCESLSYSPDNMLDTIADFKTILVWSACEILAQRNLNHKSLLKARKNKYSIR